ncbi:MAG TPA: ferredoxin family protein [Chthoniobacteraceae bacterium]|jgi:Pyruvate/2-oxoacid:ferredoxin oxidoreductase delta subunit|nr:4Fe-4S ferredoxin iron-sulfur binding domain protein [Chthoniobacter sp.]HEV7868630.1 ferredoxin family protein [Chthoniobacteraceae bacterium]
MPLAPGLRVVLFEGEGAQPLESTDRFQTVAALLERGFAVTSASGERAVAPADSSPAVVIGHFRGTPPEVSGASTRNIAGLNSGQIADLVETARNEAAAPQHGTWKPWFPVIDYDRCTNCMQCLSFCLFGVYGVDGDKRIQVQNNDNCKTNCPACSRVCPEAAIMFPKYKAGPINGDVVSEGDLQKEKMKVDISALLGGDVYAMLRLRSEKAKSRFSKERDSDKALAERQKCLVKLASMGDIPPEVLMSLPSPEEIARRAEEAAAKAQAALAAQG